jgi:hypothetical protein
VIELNRNGKHPPFLPAAPLELMITGKMKRMPWIVGIVESEGLYPVASFIANDAELKKLDEEFDELVPLLLDYYHTVNESHRLAVTQKIRKEYFGDKKIDKDAVKQIIKVKKLG